MYAVTVEFEIKEENVTEFRNVVLRQAANSLTGEEACRRFDVCLSDDAPAFVFLYELYDDAAAFAQHRETEHFKAFSLTVQPWIKNKTVKTWGLETP